jgi:hypothetical protein
LKPMGGIGLKNIFWAVQWVGHRGPAPVLVRHPKRLENYHALIISLLGYSIILLKSKLVFHFQKTDVIVWKDYIFHDRHYLVKNTTSSCPITCIKSII